MHARDVQLCLTVARLQVRQKNKRDSIAAGNPCSSDSKSFGFVLVTDSESRKQVRRHAMRQYVQQRRMDGIARLSTRAQLGGWVKGKSPGASEQFWKAEEIPDANSNQCGTRAPSGESIDVIDVQGFPAITVDASRPSSLFDKDFRLKSSLRPVRWIGKPCTIPIPSSPGSDPFDSYPLKLNQLDHSLIYHCELFTPPFTVLR